MPVAHANLKGATGKLIVIVTSSSLMDLKPSRTTAQRRKETPPRLRKKVTASKTALTRGFSRLTRASTATLPRSRAVKPTAAATTYRPREAGYLDGAGDGGPKHGAPQAIAGDDNHHDDEWNGADHEECRTDYPTEPRRRMPWSQTPSATLGMLDPFPYILHHLRSRKAFRVELRPDLVPGLLYDRRHLGPFLR